MPGPLRHGTGAGAAVPHAGHHALVPGPARPGPRALPAHRLCPRPGRVAHGLHGVAPGLGGRRLRRGGPPLPAVEQSDTRGARRRGHRQSARGHELRHRPGPRRLRRAERAALGTGRPEGDRRRRSLQRRHHDAGPRGRQLLSRHPGQGGSGDGRYDRGIGTRRVPHGRGASAADRPGPPRRARPLRRCGRRVQRGRGPKALLALDWDAASDPTGSTAHMAASGVVGPTSGAVIVSTTALRLVPQAPERGAAGGRHGRTDEPVDRAHGLGAGRGQHPAPAGGGGGASARVGQSGLRAPRRQGDHRPMERLHARQGGRTSWSAPTWRSPPPARPGAASPTRPSCTPTDGHGLVVLRVDTGAVGDGVWTRRTRRRRREQRRTTDPVDTKVVAIHFAP